MKKLFLLILILVALFLSSCEDYSISKIGSADGPTAIIVADK